MRRDFNLKCSLTVIMKFVYFDKMTNFMLIKLVEIVDV